MGGKETLFECAWSAETSADPDGWRADNPSWGQCAVTALAVQATLGGDLMRTTVCGTSHYFNRLPDGTTVDLTWQQFPQGSFYDDDPEIRSREYVLSFPDTARRYELLLSRRYHFLLKGTR